MEKKYIKNNIESSCNQPISPHMAYFQIKTRIIHQAPSQKYEKLKYQTSFPTLVPSTQLLDKISMFGYIFTCVRCCSHCCYSTVLLLGPPATNMRYVPPIFCSSFHLSSFLKLQISKKAMQLKLHIYPYSPPSISCSSLSSMYYYYSYWHTRHSINYQALEGLFTTNLLSLCQTRKGEKVISHPRKWA